MKKIKRQLEPVPFTRVQFEEKFWAPRLETDRTMTILHIAQEQFG